VTPGSEIMCYAMNMQSFMIRSWYGPCPQSRGHKPGTTYRGISWWISCGSAHR